jgi:hypothetical protein
MQTKASIPVDIKKRDEMLRVVKSCIGTKYLSRWYVEKKTEKFYFYRRN